MRALISWELYFLPSISVLHLVPMWRLTERIVRSGLVMAWRLATSPTSTSPAFEKPTTEGVVRAPSALGMTVGSPASSTETTELVVPRSMPTALGMGCSSRDLKLWSDYKNLSPPLSSPRRPSPIPSFWRSCGPNNTTHDRQKRWSGAVFGQAAGGGEGNRQEVLGGAQAQAAGGAPALAEAVHAVPPHPLAPHQGRDRVPGVGRHLAGRGVVTGDDEDVGAELADGGDDAVESLDGRD